MKRERPIPITVNVVTHTTISATDLGRALLHHALVEGDIDDAGCDLYTNGGAKVYVGEEGPHVCENRRIALLIDAANTLIHGKRFTITNIPRPEESEGSE